MFTFDIRRAVICAAALASLTGCIKNDLPYPRIQPNFTAFVVENQSRSSVIDSLQRTVTVYLDEKADIENVKVLDWSITPGAHTPDSAMLDSGLDLTSPVDVTLSIYQDYVWTITGRQDIERYFTVAGQVGTSVIDVENHTVTATVSGSVSLAAVRVTSLKLGGADAVVTPSLVGRNVDFTSPLTVDVTEHGRTVKWTITVERTNVAVAISSVDAWTCVAWLYAEAEAGRSHGFEYRQASSENWTKVPDNWIVTQGGSFTGRLIGLSPSTSYVVRAVSDGQTSDEVTFTTGAAPQLPNSNFEQWWQDGKVWKPWAQDGQQFWDTGNRGAATLGQSNTLPLAVPESPTGYEGALCETRFVGISVIGKLAAGNIYAGTFVKVDGTNGVLDMGRPFTERSTKVKVRIKYKNVNITHAREFPDMLGKPDTCTVWCALGDWDKPYEIRTNPNNRHLFNKEDPGVIAYGLFQSGDPIEDFTEVTVPFDYYATDRVPKYILVTLSASKYGDFFVGGNGSTLTVTSVELLYDYDTDDPIKK